MAALGALKGAAIAIHSSPMTAEFVPLEAAPAPSLPPSWRPAARWALPDEAATTTLARRIAPRLVAGDTLLLEGPLGSGKTHFARALVRARFGAGGGGVAVPSPSFTLVQTYAPPGPEIWHADLYRLTTADEVVELGLEEAFDAAICLIEWPSRLGGGWSPAAVALHFETPPADPDARVIRLSGPGGSPLAAPLSGCGAPP